MLYNGCGSSVVWLNLADDPRVGGDNTMTVKQGFKVGQQKIVLTSEIADAAIERIIGSSGVRADAKLGEERVVAVSRIRFWKRVALTRRAN